MLGGGLIAAGAAIGAAGATGAVPVVGGVDFRVTRTVSLRSGTADVFFISLGSNSSLINRYYFNYCLVYKMFFKLLTIRKETMLISFKPLKRWDVKPSAVFSEMWSIWAQDFSCQRRGLSSLARFLGLVLREGEKRRALGEMNHPMPSP